MMDINAFLKSLSRDGFTERQRRQQERLAYYYGTQHDDKSYNFDGTNFNKSDRHNTGGSSSKYIRLRDRRPDTPDRLPKRIVNSFTQLIFSKSMAPRFNSKDDDTVSFINHVIANSRLIKKFSKARSIGGACGTVAVVPSADNGDLTIRVINPVNLHVLEWEDEDDLVPAIVVQQYEFEKEIINADGSKFCKKYLARRFWDNQVSEYFEAEYDGKSDPNWTLIDSVEHGLSRCPVVWIQNEPPCDDFDTEGQADYDDRLLDLFDRIDYQWSNINRALGSNFDPTLGIGGLTESDDGSSSLAKGSDNALNLGISGHAAYIEAQFPGMATGLEFIGKLQQNVQSATQCTILDPERFMGQAQSGEALRRLMAPMFARVETFRDQYEDAIRQVIALFAEMARNMPDAVRSPVIPPETLEYELRWPPYMRPTPEEATATINNALAAKGTLITQETATTHVAHVFDVDNPQVELEKLLAENEAKRAELEESMKRSMEDDNGGDT